MNMPASSSHISSRIDLNGQPADPVQEKPATLAPADIEALQKTLGSGLAGFARQGDIVELHKRIGEKFEKLPQELDARAEPHRTALLARIEALEKSLSGLEAAVRIELPPLLGETVTGAVAANMPRRARRGWTLLGLLCAAALGVVAGALLHQPLAEYAARLGGF